MINSTTTHWSYWDNVIKRICKESSDKFRDNDIDGLLIVSLNAIVDHNNRPILWTIESKRIEPSRSAKDILTGLLT